MGVGRQFTDRVAAIESIELRQFLCILANDCRYFAQQPGTFEGWHIAPDPGSDGGSEDCPVDIRAFCLRDMCDERAVGRIVRGTVPARRRCMPPAIIVKVVLICNCHLFSQSLRAEPAYEDRKSTRLNSSH